MRANSVLGGRSHSRRQDARPCAGTCRRCKRSPPPPNLPWPTSRPVPAPRSAARPVERSPGSADRIVADSRFLMCRPTAASRVSGFGGSGSCLATSAASSRGFERTRLAWGSFWPLGNAAFGLRQTSSSSAVGCCLRRVAPDAGRIAASRSDLWRFVASLTQKSGSACPLVSVQRDRERFLCGSAAGPLHGPGRDLDAAPRRFR